jgi:site-specific DNA-methyltransferase (adenine-specific)
MFPSNVLSVENIHEVIDKYFLVAKPSKNEKRSYNDHRTVKPLAICEYIIKLATFSNDAVVLDPFIGSGTTALAAKKLGRNYIGVDINEKYVKIALKRLGIVEEKLKKIDGIKFNGSLPQILDL